MSLFIFSGCDFLRKVKGAETLSFKMRVDYKQGDTAVTVNMDCYKTVNEKTEEYAYVYTCDQAKYQSYKNIYADDKLYEVVNPTPLSGFYYVKDNVKADDDGNILYRVTHNIMLTSVAALVIKAKKRDRQRTKTVSLRRYDRQKPRFGLL